MRPIILKPGELAGKLGRTKRTVERWANQNKIPSVIKTKGGQSRFLYNVELRLWVGRNNRERQQRKDERDLQQILRRYRDRPGPKPDFSITNAVGGLIRHLRQQENKQPISEWSPARRAALRQLFQPLAKICNQL